MEQTFEMVVDKGTKNNFAGAVSYNENTLTAEGKSVAYVKARLTKLLRRDHKVENVKITVTYKETVKK